MLTQPATDQIAPATSRQQRSDMWAFVGKKLTGIVPVILLVSLATAGLVSLIPGTPGDLILGEFATEEAIHAFNEEHGFNDPFLVRYWDWMSGALRGDLGDSVVTGNSAASMFLKALPVTMELAGLSLALSLLLSVGCAVASAAKPNGLIDRLSAAVANTVLAMPAFVAAVFASQLLSANTLHLPTYGWVPITESVTENLRYSVLPVLVLTSVAAPLMFRVLRTDMVALLNQDFVVAARAKGLTNMYVVTRHVLRPASSSLFTVVGLLFGYLVGGSVIVESFFSVPGIGQLVARSIRAHDIVVVQGVVLYSALAYMVINVAVDVLQVALNPQLREEL